MDLNTLDVIAAAAARISKKWNEELKMQPNREA